MHLFEIIDDMLDAQVYHDINSVLLGNLHA